jgi:hypothetical protein
MKYAAIIVFSATSLALGSATMPGQSVASPEATGQSQLTEHGKTDVGGHSTQYLIHLLPASSFPDLPDAIANVLNERGCMIPQTYQAHHPENVVEASLEHAGSSDWAVLCSTRGTVALLVFFARAPGHPVTLASAAETDRLQAHDSSGVLGFDWGIDPASPTKVREAQAGMEHHPPLLDHDALAETVINQRTTYHFYAKNAWTLLEMPE